ncbi:MAG: hypothetical protein OHK006_08870 [Thermodesulfovibrionales bacterium]
MGKIAASVSAILLAVLLSGAEAVDKPAATAGMNPSEYTVTVIPFYGPEKIWTRFSPLVEYLRKKTGKPWELKLYATHDALIAGLCSNEVSFALLGPVPLGRVIERCKAEPVVVAVDKAGKPFYRSMLITTDPAVTKPADLAGKKFGVFKGSTAAHVVPLTMLRDAGVTKAALDLVYFDSQDHIMNALLARTISGAGVKEPLYRKFEKQVTLLTTSEQLPNFAFAAGPSVKAATKKAFASALLRLRPRTGAKDAELMKEWDDEIRNGFILPPASYRSSVMSLLPVTHEIMRDDR